MFCRLTKLTKVLASGEGISGEGVLASLPVSFTIDTSNAGTADLDVFIKVKKSFYLFDYL